jgi:hypothetical protein
VALVTDAQASATDSLAPVGAPVVVLATMTATPANGGVTMAEARPVRWTPRGAVVARVQGTDSASYRVVLGGTTVARGSVAPDHEVIVPIAPAARGWTAGLVEIQPDEYPLDDSRHFAVWIGSPPPVTVHPAAGEFMASAIEVLRASGRVSSAGTASASGTWIGPSDALERLPALITAPADPVRLGAANRALERAGVPWRLGQRLVRTGAASGPGLDGVEVMDRYQLIPQSGAVADTLVLVAGQPWAVHGPGYVIIASPMDPGATTLPVRAGFVPWVGSVVADRLGAGAGQVIHAEPGTRVPRPVGASGLEVQGRVQSLGDSIAVPDAAGVYFLRQGNERVGAIVANTDPRESLLAPIPVSQLGQRLSARHAGSDSRAWISAAFDTAARRSMLPFLLAVLLAALVLETLILRGRRGAAA